MKGRSFIVAVMAGAFLAAFAGIPQAGETGGSVDETAEYRIYNAFDTVDHWGPVETGALPGSGMSGRSPEAGAESRMYNAFDTVEHWGPPGEIRVDPSEWEKPTAE